jgi:prepilin-type N-terminal cleavage/methylation domain-containing protein
MARGHGFTLIEMLVVVAIIVLMAMMLLPVYETAIKHSERSVCLVNIKNLVTANGLYAEDYDGRCVPARVDGPKGTYGTCWDVLLMPYFRAPQMLVCPSDPMPGQTSGSVSYKHSYGINYGISLIGGYNGQSQLMDRIEDQTATILFFDIRGSARSMGANAQVEGVTKVDSRHGDGANFAYVAGNVTWHRAETTLQPRSFTSVKSSWEP